MEVDESINEIKIKSNHLLNMLECTICCMTLTNTVITPCGHSFCSSCILNWINLHNDCPSCKAKLSPESLIKDYLVDAIAKGVQSERSKEEYLLIENSHLNNNHKAKASGMNSLSKIQSIFFEALKEVFNSYNQFFGKIEKQYKEQANAIQMKIDAMDKLAVDSSAIDNLNKEKATIEMNSIKIKEVIECNLRDYLQNLPMNPLQLSMSTRIYIEKKNIYIENVLLQPSDSCDKIYAVITSYFQSRFDELVNWGSSALFVHHQLPNGNKEIMGDAIERESRVLSLKIIPGDELILKGDFMLKSEEKKPCITFNFESNKKQSVNYFSCEQCKLNCKSI